MLNGTGITTGYFSYLQILMWPLRNLHEVKSGELQIICKHWLTFKQAYSMHYRVQ